MSQDTKGSGDNFLSRWSQRKREASLPEPAPEVVPVAENAEVQAVTPEKGEAEPEFDLSSLPKLEDLTGTTDITQFLRKGVPESLRNAALRKSWALDPAIRDYVNPALDYAFDWNTPGGVPGNSELAAGTDITKMVLQIMGTTPAAEAESDTPADLPRHVADDHGGSEIAIGAMQESESLPEPVSVRLSPLPSEPLSIVDSTLPEPELIVARTDANDRPDDAPQQKMRRHGAAKPVF